MIPTRDLEVTLSDDRQTIGLVLSGVSHFSSKSLLQNQVEASLEKHDVNIRGELGWMPIGPEVALAGTPVNQTSHLFSWQGSLQLSEKYVPGHFRVVIKEYEVFTADAPSPANSTSIGDVTARRLVYTDEIEF
jgi:hypothetical protein